MSDSGTVQISKVWWAKPEVTIFGKQKFTQLRVKKNNNACTHKAKNNNSKNKKAFLMGLLKCLTFGIPCEKASLYTPCYLSPGCLRNKGLNSTWAVPVGSSALGQTPILRWVELVLKFDTYQLSAMFTVHGVCPWWTQGRFPPHRKKDVKFEKWLGNTVRRGHKTRAQTYNPAIMQVIFLKAVK